MSKIQIKQKLKTTLKEPVKETSGYPDLSQMQANISQKELAQVWVETYLKTLDIPMPKLR